MKPLLFLTLAHYIADYPLQGDFLGTMKGKFKYLMFCHCLIWSGCVCAVLEYYGMFEWWKFGFLFIGHFCVDMWKATHPKAKEEGLTRLLWIDQFIHFVQIIIVAIK